MKKTLITLICIATAVAVYAQQAPINIVFDVTSSEPSTHQSAVRHIKLMSSSYPDAKFEVVMYSGSYKMALKEKSSVAREITELAGRNNVSFKVCAMTLKRKNIDESDLLPNIEIVPDGILEIATKQREGWGYIKESH